MKADLPQVLTKSFAAVYLYLIMNLTRTAKVLLTGANIWYFGEGMMGPLFAVFAEKVGGDILDITWAWAAYLVITGVLYILIGKALNKKSYKVKSNGGRVFPECTVYVWLSAGRLSS
jgi:hypothetical protein